MPTRLRFVWASLFSLPVLLAYSAIAAFLKATPLPVVINNTFFLASTVIMGMFASYGLEYYTRKVFWQSVMLEEKRRLLDAEHNRKTRELDQARRLQQSMLPPELPDHPKIEMAAMIRPATEIAGDYYDYHVAADGTITLVIGDATGHGASAGTMVMGMKILFATLAQEPEIVDILATANSALRRAGVSKVNMALALAQFSEGMLELAGAGMPAALVYRASTGVVEEHSLKGMPLGATYDFPYQKRRVQLQPGDSVLLTSDGLPELVGQHGEMLGDAEVAKVFGEAAPFGPRSVMRRLESTMDRWTCGATPKDDVAILVFRVKTDTE